METRKLYYEDCMMAQFRATVISCEAVTDGYEVTLDATAFYPEGADRPATLVSSAVRRCWMFRSGEKR